MANTGDTTAESTTVNAEEVATEEVAAETLTPVYLDQLREYAVRGADRIKVGDEVIFCHVPPLENPDLEDHRVQASALCAKITEVAYKSFNDLHPGLKANFPGSDKKLLMLFHKSNYGLTNRHASDSGVIPYGDDKHSNFYNSTNFTVLVSELKELGFIPVLTVTPEYSDRLYKFNAQIEVREWDYDAYGEDRGM